MPSLVSRESQMPSEVVEMESQMPSEVVEMESQMPSEVVEMESQRPQPRDSWNHKSQSPQLLIWDLATFIVLGR